MARSLTHCLDLRDLRGNGRVVIYRRADHQRPKWTARLKIPGAAGFVVRSTKTSDEGEARRVAEDLYFEIEGRVRRGEPVRAPTFRQVFERWRASLNRGGSPSPTQYVNGNVRRVEKWALRHFGDRPIIDLNDAAVLGYFDWRAGSSGKAPAAATLRNERTALRMMLTVNRH